MTLPRKLNLWIVMFFGLVFLSQPARTGPAPSASESVVNLMPLPAKIVFGPGKLKIDSSFRVSLNGYQEPRLALAADRFLKRLVLVTGIPLSLTIEKNPARAALEIRCSGPGQKLQTVAEDESYGLEITSQKGVLRAGTPVGILRGVETILQLVSLDADSFFIPVLQILDAPRFPWRGLMIDVCRHWEPVDVIKRNLEAMAAVKLNVLHWHLSEDQGFRVESKVFPKLQEFGSDGNYYTQPEIREVIDHARNLGIRVIPEFDMPGHSTAWFVGYPEIASAPGPYAIERHWGVFDPTMDPTRKEVYKFLDKFIGEMARLFPDEYFHIGGDEVTGKQWDNNPAITAFKTANGMKSNDDLQAHFNNKILAIIKKHGKKMVGWDEIFHPDLPKDIVIQSWRGQKSLADAARQGYMGVLSAGYYLDHMLPASEHYGVDPLEKETADLANEQKVRVLGGEACMWGEFVNPKTIDSRIWPRLAAIAERFWSPQAAKDADDMYRRLDVTGHLLNLFGISEGRNSMAMLRRLSGHHPVGSLRVLADIVEPLHLYLRPDVREYTQFTPLNRLVDAAKPESAGAREFQSLVEGFLADGPSYVVNREKLIEKLVRWRNNEAILRPILEGSYLLKEIIPLSERLKIAAESALKALDYLVNDLDVPPGWKEENLALLKGPEKPGYEVDLVIIPAVQKLVESAAAGKKQAEIEPISSSENL